MLRHSSDRNNVLSIRAPYLCLSVCQWHASPLPHGCAEGWCDSHHTSMTGGMAQKTRANLIPNPAYSKMEVTKQPRRSPPPCPSGETDLAGLSPPSRLPMAV